MGQPKDRLAAVKVELIQGDRVMNQLEKTEIGTQSAVEKTNLAELSKLTGFPIKMIKDELLLSQDENQEVSIEELREAMLKFIDQSFKFEAGSI